MVSRVLFVCLSIIFILNQSDGKKSKNEIDQLIDQFCIERLGGKTELTEIQRLLIKTEFSEKTIDRICTTKNQVTATTFAPETAEKKIENRCFFWYYWYYWYYYDDPDTTPTPIDSPEVPVTVKPNVDKLENEFGSTGSVSQEDDYYKLESCELCRSPEYFSDESMDLPEISRHQKEYTMDDYGTVTSLEFDGKKLVKKRKRKTISKSGKRKKRRGKKRGKKRKHSKLSLHKTKKLKNQIKKSKKPNNKHGTNVKRTKGSMATNTTLRVFDSNKTPMKFTYEQSPIKRNSNVKQHYTISINDVRKVDGRRNNRMKLVKNSGTDKKIQKLRKKIQKPLVKVIIEEQKYYGN